jgi:hypothetical protein
MPLLLIFCKNNGFTDEFATFLHIGAVDGLGSDYEISSHQKPLPEAATNRTSGNTQVL